MIRDGHLMPLDVGYEVNMYGQNKGNQVQPLLVTSFGQYAWSEYPMKLKVKKGKVIIDVMGGDEIEMGKVGNSLAEVHKYVSENFFPASGLLPDTFMFTAPQYNTWIELNYNHNQEDILNYARAIIDNGLPPGVLIIDDTWQEDYGMWDFHPGRFPDPKGMINEIHAMGFKVMLWICPFVSPDQKVLYEFLNNNKALLLEKESDECTWETATNPEMVRWWNGVSAVLDFSNKFAIDWFNEQTKRLTVNYNIDGFKFDGGDFYFYTDEMISKRKMIPNEQSKFYAEFGLQFPFNEYRACWKMGGKPLVQRLHDKNHDWKDLKKIIPQVILMGFSGYPFACPDMIGGGNFETFKEESEIDQELIVRSAQCQALMPMMQFSVAPWRVLDSVNMAVVKETIELREKFTPLIKRLAINTASTGEPIIKSMDYVFPGKGLEEVNDQFMLGDSVLVAPFLSPGQTAREVYLPEGFWVSDEMEYITGGKTFTVNASLKRLPYFIMIDTTDETIN